MPTIDCACREAAQRFDAYTRLFVGVDETNGRYGQVEILTCRRCGQRWLSYSVEYEGFSKSGRWYLGMIGAAAVTPESAVGKFERMEWYFAGGSYFNGVTGKSKGRPKVDL